MDVSMEMVLPLGGFVIATTFSPGGATALATASGAGFGVRRSMPLIFGIASSLAFLACCAVLGVAGLLVAFPTLDKLMKITGTLYLTWLAWKIASGMRPTEKNLDEVAPMSYITGMLLQLVNPKGWAMALGAAASFVSLADSAILRAFLIGTAFAVSSTIALTLWSLLGVLIASMLRTDAQWRVLNVTLGILLLASIIPIWI